MYLIWSLMYCELKVFYAVNVTLVIRKVADMET